MSKNTLLSELINYVSANASGNVTIAAPSSGYALDVTGTGRFTGALTLEAANNQIRSGNELRFYRADNGIYTTLNDAGTGAANGFILNNTNGEGFHFKNAATTIMRMNSAGNIGINTNTPVGNDGTSKTFQIGTKLAIQNVIGTQFLLSSNAYYDGTWSYMAAGKAQAVRGTGESGAIQFHLSPTGTAGGAITNMDSSDIKMVIKESGNVAIGTTTPLQTTTNRTVLTINGTNQAIINLGYSGTLGGYLYSDNSNYTELYSVGQLALLANANQPMTFTAIGSERMRIAANSSFCIRRTTSPGSAYSMAIQEAIAMYVNTNGNNMINFFNSSESYVASISVSAGSVSYGTGSDYRIKEDFKEFNGLEKLSAIKVYDFKLKQGGERMDGVIAHELQDVIPYAVTGIKDEVDEQGNDKIQNVDYSKIVPVLIKSIQEQQAQIEELKQLINN